MTISHLLFNFNTKHAKCIIKGVWKLLKKHPKNCSPPFFKHNYFTYQLPQWHVSCLCGAVIIKMPHFLADNTVLFVEWAITVDRKQRLHDNISSNGVHVISLLVYCVVVCTVTLMWKCMTQKDEKLITFEWWNCQ